MPGEEREQCLPVSLTKDIGSRYGNFKVSLLVKDWGERCKAFTNHMVNYAHVFDFIGLGRLTRGD